MWAECLSSPGLQGNKFDHLLPFPRNFVVKREKNWATICRRKQSYFARSTEHIGVCLQPFINACGPPPSLRRPTPHLSVPVLHVIAVPAPGNHHDVPWARSPNGRADRREPVLHHVPGHGQTTGVNRNGSVGGGRPSTACAPQGRGCVSGRCMGASPNMHRDAPLVVPLSLLQVRFKPERYVPLILEREVHVSAVLVDHLLRQARDHVLHTGGWGGSLPCTQHSWT